MIILHSCCYFSISSLYIVIPFSVGRGVVDYLLIYLFIHYATEAAHITLQTYKIKHKVKTQSIKNSKNTTQQRNHKFTVWNVLLLIDNYACVKGTFI